MPEPVKAPAPPQVLAAPTVALARGRTVGSPVGRREFRRADTIVIRAETTKEPAVTARLLDRHGQPLTDVPATSTAGACEVTLALGNLGPGDYVIEISARAPAESIQQYVAFRVIR